MRWYHVTGMEGAAGYFVVLAGGAGAVAGFLAGMIATMMVLGAGGGFGRALGVSMGIVAALACACYGLARLFGDVPPTLRGSELYVEVELRCPPEWAPSNRVRSGRNTVTLRAISASGQAGHASSAPMRWEDTRTDEGRTVFGEVLHLFTSSGQRRLEFILGEQPVGEIVAPLRGHPGAEEERWSSWLPVSDATPARGYQYRFRVVRVEDWDRAREQREAQEFAKRVDAFAQLHDRSPMEQWLAFRPREGDRRDEQSRTMGQEAAEVFRARPGEVVALIASEDAATASAALEAAAHLNALPPETGPALRKAARHLAGRIERYNAAFQPEDPDFAEALRLKLFFLKWADTWERFADGSAVSAPAELRRIREAAEHAPKETEAGALVSLTEFYQKRWAARFPAPR